jgi:hypothetical protein
MATSLPSVLESTPQERLAISRRAIVRHMTRHDGQQQQTSPNGLSDEIGDDQREPGGSTWSMFKRAARSWWKNHPANVAADFAAPVLSGYARKHPFRILGIAAGIGALAVAVKPWRLVSLGGLLLATVKSSDITSMLLSMLTPPHDPDEDSQPNSLSNNERTG